MVAQESEQVRQNGRAYAKLVAKVWSDPDAKQKFLEDPKTALASEGFTVPAGVTVKVLENTDKLMYVVNWAATAAVLAEQGTSVPADVAVKVVNNTDKVMHVVLPMPPSTDELSEEELEKIAGGTIAGETLAVGRLGGYYCN
jgi:hypothetical protein